MARAVVLRPKFVVLDEPTSALDMLIQCQICDLLRDLQSRLGLTYLFISHDLKVVAALASRLIVMRNGKIVEAGPAQELFRNPYAEIEKPLKDLRYINEYAATLSEPFFEVPKSFTGLHYRWGIDQRDNPRLTTRGVLLEQESYFVKGITDRAADYTAHALAISFYQSFKLPAKVTFAWRIGGGLNSGHYELYQAQILDGKTELRGFRKTRFYGDSKVFSNAEVRLKLASIKTYLFPASVGINAF